MIPSSQDTYKKVPTDKLIRSYVEKFNSDKDKKFHNENYQAVLKVVKQFHSNDKSYQNIYLKIHLINSAFNAGVGDKNHLAQSIYKIKNIDERLEGGDTELIYEIGYYAKEESVRRFYSFATKYCHLHYPDKYFIYDSFVKKSLSDFSENHPLRFRFIKNRLNTYNSFSEIMNEFKAAFNLTVDNTTLDRFLWGLGKYK